MLTLGMVVVFAGYTVGSYGWVLVKGWNIPFRRWVSPLNPYTWPSGGGDPTPIPANKLFPSSVAPAAARGAAPAGTAPGAATQPATGSGNKSFGNVPIRTQ
jgi:hypothetical protein